MVGRCALALAAASLIAVVPPSARAEAEAPPKLWVKKEKPKGLTYGGRIFSSIAPDLAMRGDFEDRFHWKSGLDFRVRYRFADNARFVVSGLVRYDLRVGDRPESDIRIDLGESYLHVRKGPFALRAGRLVETWGRNALLSPMNKLNPIDLATALEPEGAADARIPVLAARATLGFHPLSLELIWIPFFQPARLSIYGRDFSVMRPGYLEATLPSLVPGTGAGVVDDELSRFATRLADALKDLDPYVRDGVQTYVLPGLPQKTPWSGDLGFQLGLAGPSIDFDAAILWHRQDQPEIVIHEALRAPLLGNRLPDSSELTQLTNPDAELVTSSYPRSLMVGADVAIAAGGFVVSVEGALETTRSLYTRELDVYRSPTVEWAAAVRYNFGTVFAFTAEFGHDVILRHRPDTFFVRQHELQAAALATLRLFRDRLQVSLSGSWGIRQGDLYVHPRVLWEAGDGLVVAFGVQLFEGFGQPAEPTLASFLSYGGGVFGWFRANDYAYATVEYRF